LVKEFSLKNWKNGGLNKLLEKIDDIGSTARPPGILCLPVAIKVMKLMITAARAYSLGSTSLLRRILNAPQNHIAYTEL